MPLPRNAPGQKLIVVISRAKLRKKREDILPNTQGSSRVHRKGRPCSPSLLRLNKRKVACSTAEGSFAQPQPSATDACFPLNTLNGHVGDKDPALFGTLPSHASRGAFSKRRACGHKFLPQFLRYIHWYKSEYKAGFTVRSTLLHTSEGVSRFRYNLSISRVPALLPFETGGPTNSHKICRTALCVMPFARAMLRKLFAPSE